MKILDEHWDVSKGIVNKQLAAWASGNCIANEETLKVFWSVSYCFI